MNDDRTISNKELTRQELWEQFLMDYENGKKWSGNVSFGNVQIKELNDKLD